MASKPLVIYLDNSRNGNKDDVAGIIGEVYRMISELKEDQSHSQQPNNGHHSILDFKMISFSEIHDYCKEVILDDGSESIANKSQKSGSSVDKKSKKRSAIVESLDTLHDVGPDRASQSRHMANQLDAVLSNFQIKSDNQDQSTISKNCSVVILYGILYYKVITNSIFKKRALNLQTTLWT